MNGGMGEPLADPLMEPPLDPSMAQDPGVLPEDEAYLP